MNHFLVALFASVGSFTALAGDNVWTSVGPDGGLIRQVVVAPSAPSVLYAVGHGGAWKSVDGGAHWAAARTGITELTLQAVAVDPTNAQVVYVASILAGGVFKSVDGGASWTPVNNGIGITTIASLAIDPSSPGTVYAGTACCASALYKSSNAGASWTLMQGGLPQSTVSAIVIDPTSPSTVYAGLQSQGVYKSTNGGATWAAVNAGLLTSSNGAFNSLNGLAIDPVATGTLYAATSGAVFKTVNGGATWAPSNGALVNPIASSIAVNPQAPATLYIGTVGGVRRSTDAGATWVLANSGLTANVGTLAIDPVNPTRIYGGTQLGMFVTANGGASWTASNTGLANATIQALVIDPTNAMTLYIGTAGNGVQKSVDGGATWTEGKIGMTAGNGGFDIRALAIDPANPATLYAGSGAGIFKSVNAGASWASIEHGTLIRNISSIVIDPLAPSTIRVGTFFTGVFVSTNGGDTWTTDNQGLPAPPSVNALAIANGAVVANTFTNGSFGHDLDASGWRAIGGLTSSTRLASVGTIQLQGAAAAARPNGPTSLEVTAGGAGSGGEVILGFFVVLFLLLMGAFSSSIDFTVTNIWQPVLPPPGLDMRACPPIKAIAAGTPGTFYAGGSCGVIAVSGNGEQVAMLNNGLPNLQISALGVTPGGTDLYAGAEGGGVFRYTKSGAATPVTVVEYYNASLDHYFITWVAAEQANLDAGNTPTRWARTGVTFKTYTTPQTGASPVCRYYIPPNLGDSHFFGRGTQECTATGQNNPSFVLESPDFMHLFLPSAGTCPAGTINVYRVFSNRADANHRYMIDTAIRAQMVARGWLVEGDGPDAVVMCAPQ